MAEGQDFAHDTLYRALNQPLASFFELSLELCKAMGGLDRGYLILDDVLIQRYRSGKLGLKKARDTSTWTDGKRRIPLAFLPYFGEEESKLWPWPCWSGPRRRAFVRRGCSLTPGTRRGRSWSGSMPTAGLLSRGSGRVKMYV
jgi:hypothetical protein